MESGARGNSSRRKSMPLKVRLSFGSQNYEKVNGDTSKSDVEIISENDSDSQDDKDIPELPEGTVVVQPEAVQEKAIRFKGPEFKPSGKKSAGGGTAAAGSNLTVLENLFCTACGRQVNPWKTGMAKKHKDLRVLICRKCYNFLGSGEIVQDEDGMDEQCRWCGEGGRLTVCDNCPRAFCKGCIMRNFGRAAFTAVTESENWECYICDQEPLEELKKHCKAVFDAISAADNKKTAKSSQPSKSSSKSSLLSPASSSKSQSELADDPASVMSKMFTRVDFDEDMVVPVTSKLLEATTTFRHMLLDIQRAIDSGSRSFADDLESLPLFAFSEDMNINQKKQRCIKVLRKGLQIFCTSISRILNMKSSGNDCSGHSKSSALSKPSLVASSKCNGGAKFHESPKSSSSETLEQSKFGSSSKSGSKHSSVHLANRSRNSLAESGNNSLSRKSENNVQSSENSISGKEKQKDRDEKSTSQGGKEEKKGKKKRPISTDQTKVNRAESSESSPAKLNKTSNKEKKPLSGDNSQEEKSIDVDNESTTPGGNIQEEPTMKYDDNQEEPTMTSDNNQEEPTMTNDNNQEEPIMISDNNQEEPTVTRDNNQMEPVMADDDNQVEPTMVSDDNQEEPTMTGDNNQEEPIMTGDNNQEEPIMTGDNNQEEPTVTGDNNQEEPTVTGDNNQEEPTMTGGDNQEEPTMTGDNNQEEPTMTDDDNQEEPTMTDDDNQEEPTMTDDDNQEEPTMTDDDNQEEPTMTDVNNQEEPTMTDDDNQEEPTMTGDNNKRKKREKGMDRNNELNQEEEDIEHDTAEKMPKHSEEAVNKKKKVTHSVRGQTLKDKKSKYVSFESEQKKKIWETSSCELEIGMKKTFGIKTVPSSTLYDDPDDEDENLVAKLELIQELAKEFCKESDSEVETPTAYETEHAVNNVDSDEESLPEVSFGIEVPESDGSLSENDAKTSSKIPGSGKNSHKGNKCANHFSDISDADSALEQNSKDLKQDTVSKKTISSKVQGKLKTKGNDSARKKVKRRNRVDHKKDNAVLPSDGKNSQNEELSSSDLIMSSGEDEGERRVKRKRRLKRKTNTSNSSRKQDNGNSDEESESNSKSKRRVKTTPKKESQKTEANSDSTNEDSDDSNVASDSRDLDKNEGKDSEDLFSETEDKGRFKSSAKQRKGKDSRDSERPRERSRKAKCSSEEDEHLEREIGNILKESGKRLKMKVKEEEKTDDSGEADDNKSSKKNEKQCKGKAAQKGKKVKKEKDSSDSSDDEQQSDNEEQEDDDSAEENDHKSLKKIKVIKDEDVDVENELAKAAMLDEMSDNDNDEKMDEENDSSSESDIGAKKKLRNKKAKEKKDKSDKEGDGDNSDFEPAESRKRFRSKLLDAKLSDSDSDIEVNKNKGKKRKKESDDESYVGSQSDEDDEDDAEGDSVVESDDISDDGLSDGSTASRKKGKGKHKGKGKEKGKKRKRIKKMKESSSEAEVEEGEEDDEDPSSRKKIRKIKSDKKLGDTTKAAARAEEERRRRVEEKQKKFNDVETKDAGDGQAPITTKLVLERDEETEEPVIQVNEKLICKLKPHQVEAVQFMWDCMFESLKRSKKEEYSSGCILAHCMGLGKTLSVVAFIHTLMTHKKLTKVNTCLVVSPLNTVLNWQNEFEIWLDEEDQLTVYEMASVKQNGARADILEEWHKDGGIMIIGYEMLRNLSQGSRIRNKKLKAIFQKTLISPGPDIVVCDEGHIMKNSAAALSKAMNQIKTRRRVVLTGTPLQNNLIEYHCMVDFVKPNLLGTKKEFANRFVNPITNGQHSDSTGRDVRIMKNRAHVLHELLAGCVQRRDYSALTKFLPPKQEYVIPVRLSEMQIKLYEEYLQRSGQVDGQITTRGAQLFKDYQNLMKIWTHPWVLKLSEIRDENKVKYDDEDSFIDDEYSDEEKSLCSDTSSSSSEEEPPPKPASEEEESTGEGTSVGRRSRRLRNKERKYADDKDEIVKEWKTRSRGGEDDLVMEVESGPQAVSSEWWAEHVKEEDKNKMELSGKLVLLFDILRMCEEIGDKVLIFSQSLLSLDIIEYFLEHVDSKFTEETQDKPDNELKEAFGKRWVKGDDYFRLDGSTNAQLRQHWAGIFNDSANLRARLFLISTRAGGLGINLVGANRVIIFDASWNPSHDVQSIFRVYRFGQFKPCYIYRFLAQGTMEEKIYDRQVTKLSLSQRVVDEHQVERHFTAADLSELYAFKPARLSDDKKKETLLLPKDVLLAEIVSGDNRDWFAGIHEHDSLLENLVEQELTEEEKKAAWEEYENEKKGLRMNVSSMGQGNLGLGNYLSQEFLLQTARNLRLQHPDMPQEVLQMHLQRIIMMQIRQKQEEQRRLEMMERQQASQFMQMQQRYAQLQHQYMMQMGGMYPGMLPPTPGQRFSPSLYAHMAQPGISSFHGGAAAAILNSADRAGTSKETSQPSAEVIDLDESNE